jgi:hypothetical protein
MNKAVQKAKQQRAMLQWAQRVTAAGFGAHVQVRNWTSESWINGLAFCALLSHVRPDLLDFADVEFIAPRDRLLAVLRQAEQHLEVDARLLGSSAEAWCGRRIIDKDVVLPYYKVLYSALRNTRVPAAGRGSAEKAAALRTLKLLKANSAETKAELTRMFQVLDHRHHSVLPFKELASFLSRIASVREARAHGVDLLQLGVLGSLQEEAREKKDADLDVDFNAFCQCVLFISEQIAKAERRRKASGGTTSGWVPMSPAELVNQSTGGMEDEGRRGADWALAASATVAAAREASAAVGPEGSRGDDGEAAAAAGGGGGGGGGGRTARGELPELNTAWGSPKNSPGVSPLTSPTAGSARSINHDRRGGGGSGSGGSDGGGSGGGSSSISSSSSSSSKLSRVPGRGLVRLDDLDDALEPGPYGWKFEKKKKKDTVLDLRDYAGAAFRTRNSTVS